MARLLNRKRQRADELSRDNNPPAKRVRSTSGQRNFPPAFWDNLSKVWLTPRALRELDRRNNNTHSPPKFTAPEVYPTNLARFSRHGGPDLCHLRGCPEPNNMSSSRSSNPSNSRPTQFTNATSVSSRARRSSAYDDDFDQHLIDHGIYPEGYEHPGNRLTPEPGDLDQCRQELSVRRASLSPSRFPESAFRDFKRKNKTKSEGSVMSNVIPMIAGDTNIPNEGHLPFTNLRSLTDDTTVKAVPDYFDGARVADIHSQVRRDLNKTIIPTKHANVPVVPNFFLEAKAPQGGADVALRQACYDGAYGARAMHSLQNHGRDEPIYDANAYTFSSTYQGGHLQLYAHHPTGPTTPEGGPEYHMTQIRSYAMTSDRETFVQGATAFRNARDLAKHYRDNFIQTANARARGDAKMPAQEDDATEAQQDDGSSEYEDCEEFAESQDVHGVPPLQGPVGFATSQDINEEPAVPQYIGGDESQESAVLEPSTSFVTSFASSFGTQTAKRSRSSPSPPSSSRQHKKHGSTYSRTHAITSLGTAESSTQASTSASSTTKDYWTWSNSRKKWYHLREDGSREWDKSEQNK